MSISASIDIFLSEQSRANLLLLDLFRNFENEGWEYINSKGEITMLPLGDDDNFDWTTTILDRDRLFNILNKKNEQKEVIGIQLLRADSEVGCELLIFNTSQMIFSLSIARKKTKIKEAIDITDFSWYLERILPALKHLQVEQIRCEQLL